eukprot:Sdes_comp21592_c0_seq1m20194
MVPRNFIFSNHDQSTRACVLELLKSSKKSPKCPLCKATISKRSLRPNLALQDICDSFENVLIALEQDLEGHVRSCKKPNLRASPQMNLSQLYPYPEKTPQKSLEPKNIASISTSPLPLQESSYPYLMDDTSPKPLNNSPPFSINSNHKNRPNRGKLPLQPSNHQETP